MSVAALLRDPGASDTLVSGVALVVASVLFEVYHVVHCPPFNTAEITGLLALVSGGQYYFTSLASVTSFACI